MITELEHEIIPVIIFKKRTKFDNIHVFQGTMDLDLRYELKKESEGNEMRAGRRESSAKMRPKQPDKHRERFKSKLTQNKVQECRNERKRRGPSPLHSAW